MKHMILQKKRKKRIYTKNIFLMIKKYRKQIFIMTVIAVTVAGLLINITSVK